MRKEEDTRSKATGRRQKKNGLSLRSLMKLPYKIELTPLPKQDGGFLAAIPLLKGCQSDGSTPDEAIRNLREAQLAWLSSAMKHGDPIPLPQ